LRFVDELWPSNNFIYAGTGLDLVKGIGTVAVTIQTLVGPKRILLANIVYIPAFYTNLAYLDRFNNKNI